MASSFRLLFRLTPPRFQRLRSNSCSQGSRGQKLVQKAGTFEADSGQANINGFSSASNAKYVEHLFAKWLNDEKSIHVSWQRIFREFVETRDEDSKAAPLNVTHLPTKVALSQLYPNLSDIKRQFCSKKDSGSGKGSKLGGKIPIFPNPHPSRPHIDGGEGSFGFSPIPVRKKGDKSSSDKEIIPNNNNQKGEKGPSTSRSKKSDIHYFPMPIVLDSNIASQPENPDNNPANNPGNNPGNVPTPRITAVCPKACDFIMLSQTYALPDSQDQVKIRNLTDNINRMVSKKKNNYPTYQIERAARSATTKFMWTKSGKNNATGSGPSLSYHSKIDLNSWKKLYKKKLLQVLKNRSLEQQQLRYDKFLKERRIKSRTELINSIQHLVENLNGVNWSKTPKHKRKDMIAKLQMCNKILKRTTKTLKEFNEASNKSYKQVVFKDRSPITKDAISKKEPEKNATPMTMQTQINAKK